MSNGFINLPPREPDWAMLFEETGQPDVAHLCRKGRLDLAGVLLLMKEDAKTPGAAEARTAEARRVTEPKP